MAFKIKEGMEAATLIRVMSQIAGRIAAEKNTAVYDATIGAPVGATNAKLLDLIMLSMLNYRTEDAEGVFTSKQYKEILKHILKTAPELFEEGGLLAQYGFKVNRNGKTVQYTPASSLPAPRKMAVDILNEHYFPEIAGRYDETSVFFTSGGTTGLSACFAALDGDFFIPAGYFALYDNQDIAFNGNVKREDKDIPGDNHYRKIVQIPLDESWTPTAASFDAFFEKYCADKGITPAQLQGQILLCNPGNPLTTMPTEEEYARIADLLRTKYTDLNVVIDDPYSNFIYNVQDYDPAKEKTMSDAEWQALCSDRKGFLRVAPDLFDRIVVVKTLGKDVQGTGLRIGVCFCGDPKAAAGLAGSHFNIAHTPPEFMQALIPLALSEVWKPEHKASLAKTYLPRLATLFNAFNSEGILVGGDNVVGGMFTVADLSNLKGLPISPELNGLLKLLGPQHCGETIQTGMQIAIFMMLNYQVASVPGEAFALPKGMMRIAATQPDIEHTKAIAERVVAASRDAMVEHVANAITNASGITYNGAGVKVLASGIETAQLERLEQLKGVTVTQGDIYITFEFANRLAGKALLEKLSDQQKFPEARMRA